MAKWYLSKGKGRLGGRVHKREIAKFTTQNQVGIEWSKNHHDGRILLLTECRDDQTKGHACRSLEDEQENDQDEWTTTWNVEDEEGEYEDKQYLNAHHTDLDEGMGEEYLHGVHARHQTSLE